jgi:hypothetical protein
MKVKKNKYTQTRIPNGQRVGIYIIPYNFNTLLSQVNWGDHALHHWLKQALPDCIKDSLVLVEEPVAFNEWKCLVQNVDQQYWE